jgi:hypothetical protein
MRAGIFNMKPVLPTYSLMYPPLFYYVQADASYAPAAAESYVLL